MPVSLAQIQDPRPTLTEQLVLEVLGSQHDEQGRPMAFSLAEICSGYLSRVANDNVSAHLFAFTALLTRGEHLFENIDETLRELIHDGRVESTEYQGQMHYWKSETSTSPKT